MAGGARRIKWEEERRQGVWAGREAGRGQGGDCWQGGSQTGSKQPFTAECTKCTSKLSVREPYAASTEGGGGGGNNTRAICWPSVHPIYDIVEQFKLPN